MRKKIISGVLLILVACSGGAVPTSEQDIATSTPVIVTPPTELVTEPVRTTVEYEPSDEFMQNPERGFSSESDLEDTDFNEYYEDGVTLVYTTIRLDDYRESELPAELLDQMTAYFALMRSSGIKAIIRFAYNDGPYPDSEPDAPLDQILRHIEQLKPILRENADVIVWLEAGFIGAWGEWHASTNGLDEDPEAKLQTLNALLSALPEDRSVLLRYPVDIMSAFPTPLSSVDAYSGSDQSRVGFHNDCFLASSDDENTYARNGVFTYEEELDYLKQSTQFVPVGGESCALNPPRSDCPTALQELAFFHFSELGDGWNPEVLSSWEDQGCYEEIDNRLGYRFSLIDATFNKLVSPGGILHVTVDVENTGFAPPVNFRPVYLVLDGSERFEVLLPMDARLWLPGESSFDVKIRIPARAPIGDYDLSIWMPDPYDTLRDNPLYAIAFANEEVWDVATAQNRLGIIKIDAEVGGDIDPAASEIKVIE